MEVRWNDEEIIKTAWHDSELCFSTDLYRHVSWRWFHGGHTACREDAEQHVRDADELEEVNPLDKQILKDYIDACAQVKETKEALLKLRKAKKRREQDAVKGSSHEFPYTAQTFHIEGLAYAVLQDPGEEDRLEEILRERLRKAERIKHDVEAWLNTIPMRMQRIIKYKIFEGLTWNQVAIRMGRKATADGVRMEYVNFMKAA